MKLTDRERDALIIFLIFSAALIVYGRTLNHGFVYDDLLVVAYNSFIRDLRNIPALFSSAYFGLAQEDTYRPVTTLAYMLDYAVWGGEPFGFNFTQMLIHFFNGVLVYFLAGRLFSGRRRPALFTALVFVLHPVATEAVVSEGNREEALSVAFYIGALLLYLHGRDSVRFGRMRMFLAGLVYLIGLFAMEMTITLPVLLLVLEWMRRDRNSNFISRAAMVRLLPFFVLAGVFLAGRFTLWVGLGHFERFPGGSRYHAWLTMSRVCVEYIRLLWLPINLRGLYDFPISITWMNAGVLLSVGTLVFLIGLGAMLIRRGLLEGLALAWFFVALLPVSNLLVPFWYLIAERYLYLALPGFALLLGALVQRILKTQTGEARQLAMGLFCLILLLFGASAMARTDVWRSNITFWRDTAAKAPDKLDARYQLGTAYLEQGMHADAELQFKVALYDPADSAISWVRRGLIHQRLRQFQEALHCFDQALTIDPKMAAACRMKGRIYSRLGDYRQAAIWFDRAVELEPAVLGNLTALAQAKLRLGLTGEAQQAADRALRLDPQNDEALQTAADLAERAQDFRRAIELYGRQCRKSPDQACNAWVVDNLRRLGRIIAEKNI